MKRIFATFIIFLFGLLSACSASQINREDNLAANQMIDDPENELNDVSETDDDGETQPIDNPENEENNASLTEDESIAGNEQEVDPQVTPTPLPESWQDYPVVPTVSQRALRIYQAGIEAGNDPRSFSKIGDCQNITTYFLAPLEDPDRYSLGEEYSYLQKTIDHFYGSFSRESLSVAGGLNVARVLSPFHSDPDLCEPNEHPLACEIRINNPSLAIVSLEENWESRTSEEYETHLRTVIEYLIEEGVVPILATKADNLEGDHSINKAIVKLAAEYQIPLWNFWRAVQPLPHHGLHGDGFHLTQSGNYFDQKSYMKAAWPWRNLTALQSLDAVLFAINGN